MVGLLLAAWMGCDPPTPGCPEGMVLIQAGPTTIGVPLPRREWQEADRVVEIAPYCVDQYEYPNAAGQLPKAHVTWDEADALCTAAGKRLCTSAEWERACRGPQGWRYSYGRARSATTCNTPIEGPGPGNAPPPLRPAGSYPGCKSAEGVYDLNGSLSEWVSDPWTGPPEPFNTEAVVTPDAWRTLRGGTMWNRTFYGQDCTSRHGHHRNKFKNMDDGFRCCADPA